MHIVLYMKYSRALRYLSCKYEPGTLRRTRLYLNAAFARLAGVHPEEMVARHARYR